jgi:1,2-diacylglycerol 3-beta-galactosyltransferase
MRRSSWRIVFARNPTKLTFRTWFREGKSDGALFHPKVAKPIVATDGSARQATEEHRVPIRKILILMSDTGGGHRACAEALRAAFEVRYGTRFKVDVIDLWMKHTPWPLNSVPKSYRFLANEAQWFYKFVYKATEKPQVMTSVMDAALAMSTQLIKRAIWRYDPDLIICVHPLLQTVPIKVLARMDRQIPFITVVTELASTHPIWFHRAVKLYFVANERVYETALRAGVRPDHLKQYGLPIRPVFAQASRPKEMLRKELGVDPALPLVLLVGGGEGIGPVAQIAQCVAERLVADSASARRTVGQMAVICGRNRKLQEELAAVQWPIPTQVCGFVGNMHDWMAASDCIITKAGSYTIAEALARGLPILLSGYIAGQEEGNVPYVIDHGVGSYAEDPLDIARIVSRWFGADWGMLKAMSQRALELGRPQASFQIVDEIVSRFA